jgi:RNA-binding protein
MFLRSAGRRLRAEAAVGKVGAAPNVIGHVCALLARRELVKVRLGQRGTDRRAAAEALARAAGAEIVDLVGRMAVLYKPNHALPPEQRIALP